MFESFPSKETNKSREEVVGLLKEKGIGDSVAREALSKYIEESRLAVEKITDKKEHYKASIECSISNAELFYEAGYIQEAYDDLLETLEIAHQAAEEELVSKINILLDEIEPKLGS
jgi:hypothetical protein